MGIFDVAAPQLNCTARMISIALTNDPNDPVNKGSGSFTN